MNGGWPSYLDEAEQVAARAYTCPDCFTTAADGTKTFAKFGGAGCRHGERCHSCDRSLERLVPWVLMQGTTVLRFCSQACAGEE